MSPSKIGYWWSDKKNQKISAQELEVLFRDKGYELVKIDLDAPIQPQGPFQAIIHKLSDIEVKADGGDAQASEQIKNFEAFIAKHPEVIVLDPMDNVRKLLDRYRQYKLIEDSELAREDGVFTPTFVELTTPDVSENLSKLKTAGVRFPFVCKPLLAHGSSKAHQMSLIFSESGLKNINLPCVAQTFINHNARLFKLFVIKDKYFVIERPSLKNFRAGELETVYFDSHDISKPNSSSQLTELDTEDLIQGPAYEPEKARFDRIVKVVSSKLGLSLLGIDVIIENKTGRYAIIDMNAFPGYDGVDEFLTMLRDVVVDEINAKEKLKCNGSEERQKNGFYIEKCLCECFHSKSTDSNLHQSNALSIPNGICADASKTADKSVMFHNGNDIDSGIDTSDSCDEKKNKKQSHAKIIKRHSRNLTAS